ncbi:MAG: M23 family metallopeptidase [Firmicutes bacterium]|nr:M23 family metallopeptidase [Bacillota bacterium]
MKPSIVRNIKTITAVVSLLAVVAVLVGAAFTLYRPLYVYEVAMDGESLGYVESLDEYTEIVESVHGEAETKWGCDLIMTQELTASRELLWQPRLAPELVTAQIEHNADYITSGWALQVNGKDVVVVASQEEAEELLDAVKDEYLPTADNRELLNVEILDDVRTVRRAVEPEDLVNKEQAFNLLLAGQKEVSSYIVRRGDTLSGIASRSGVSVSQLREANPDVSGDTIQIGQVLNLETNSSQLRVKTVEELRVTETIPYTTRYQSNPDLSVRNDQVIQSGSNGSRDVVYKVERINGQEVNRTQVAVDVTRQPTDRIIMPGRGHWPQTPTGMFRFPMNTGRISSPFGASRGSRTHLGVDIAASRGTPIYAAADGRVSTRTYGSSYGYYLVIDHGNGYSTLYAHLNSFASNVSVGSRVVRGQLIGYVGSTGFSTGPHLHWEVRRNGNHVNPMSFFR